MSWNIFAKTLSCRESSFACKIPTKYHYISRSRRVWLVSSLFFISVAETGCGGIADSSITASREEIGSAVHNFSAPFPSSLRCRFTNSRNARLPICVTQIAGIEVKIHMPTKNSPTKHLALFFHGDTANGYLEDWGYEGLAQWSEKRGIALAALLAPNRCSWWRPSTDCVKNLFDTGANADIASRAIASLRSKLGVRGQNLYVGYSGGSTFLTSQFIPRYGSRFPGAYALNCGGYQPILSLDRSVSVSRTKLTFAYGDNDFMFTSGYISRAVRAYQAKGMVVDTQVFSGRAHCDGKVDWNGQTTRIWSSFLASIK